jgi:hypothetical protein
MNDRAHVKFGMSQSQEDWENQVTAIMVEPEQLPPVILEYSGLVAGTR